MILGEQGGAEYAYASLVHVDQHNVTPELPSSVCVALLGTVSWRGY